MAGPYPPNYGIGPGIGAARPPHPGAPPAGYPMRPPMPYPGPPPRGPRRLRLGWGAVLVVVVAALAAVLGYAVRGAGTGTSRQSASISAPAAKTAIQGYLDALIDRDIDTVARNTLCGIYDDVADHRSDNAVAKMSSDAFRKQFSQAEVTAIDKMVYLSDVQAQALFTMRVTQTSGAQRNDRTQGVAQLLWADGSVLVCSYQLRGAGSL